MNCFRLTTNFNHHNGLQKIRGHVPIILLFFIFILPDICYSQANERPSAFTIARLKYNGGGDWYNDPSAVPNLLKFIRINTNIKTATDEKQVAIMDRELFSFPVLFMTGHGKITISEEEAKRLRDYLINGGFLYADDDYGMDQYFRQMMKKVFPDKTLIELPFSHKIYHSHFDFPNGLPKIHEHDGGPPHGYGVFHEGRLIVYYSFNTNISDGWADPDVHQDPETTRQEALKIGTNIIINALTE